MTSTSAGVRARRRLPPRRYSTSAPSVSASSPQIATAARASGSSAGSRPDWRTPPRVQPDAIAAMPCFSISVTAWPSRASSAAAAAPVIPPPMMTMRSMGAIRGCAGFPGRGNDPPVIIQLPDQDKKVDNMGTESGSLSHHPYWWDAAPREAPAEVALPKRCDVAIIGAGYAGLSAALTLARAGRSVVVLDALAPGEGASSRSGGMIGHGHRLSYTKLIERFGAQKARELIREGMASLEFAKALIVDEKIDAQLQVNGRMRGAWTEADYATMTRDAHALQRDLGMAVDVLSKADVRREIAADCYQGGLLFHAHGGVHPALFHHGASAAGASRRRVRRGSHAGDGGQTRCDPIHRRNGARKYRRDCGHRHHQRLYRRHHAVARAPSRRDPELSHRHRIIGSRSRSQPDPEWPDDRRDAREASLLSRVARRHAHRVGRPRRAAPDSAGRGRRMADEGIASQFSRHWPALASAMSGPAMSR